MSNISCLQARADKYTREGRNPKTGEIIQINASKIPSLKAGKGLKEAVNTNRS